MIVDFHGRLEQQLSRRGGAGGSSRHSTEDRQTGYREHDAGQSHVDHKHCCELPAIAAHGERDEVDTGIRRCRCSHNHGYPGIAAPMSSRDGRNSAQGDDRRIRGSERPQLERLHAKLGDNEQHRPARRNRHRLCQEPERGQPVIPQQSWNGSSHLRTDHRHLETGSTGN